MKVGIYGQYYKGEAISYIEILLKTLAEKNIEAFIEEDFYDLIKVNNFPEKEYQTFSSYKDLDNSFEVMLTVGGDGTFLRAVTYVRDLDIPVLGVNIGRLGFLATVQKESIPEAINLLITKKYTINERTLLSVSSNQKNEELSEINFALNEIAVSRRNTTSMITVESYLNDEYLTSYWADGLIIATPTGSTGYSLSCGGPVITPNTRSLVLTPIAPHNLNARPLIIPENTTIKLKIISREKQALLSLDSRTTTINSNSEITIKKAKFSLKTIQLDQQTFFKTLREKLLWGEDKRN
ncbi:NAD kinase [Aureibaculum sp. 2210JD6-5]|uniref:NAD kinase n=1 Tax=Aureibaculum sp. 2210JD6-5 TaxID=3103957 RepID=UPI002AAC933D|nr:NAD kinase [Aureibaculum sp. 2210JD6-5]MDY7396258.1 NAD kinase [Aureibaculum sp. 2210JD6-5]